MQCKELIIDLFGGEDTLRLMCGVEKFTYNPNRLSFTLPSGDTVEVFERYSGLFRKETWSLKVWSSDRVLKHSSGEITSPDVLCKMFEWCTGLSLTF